MQVFFLTCVVPCRYAEFAPLPSRISQALRKIVGFNRTEMEPSAFEVQAIIASDAYLGCANFLKEALIYADVNDTVSSKSCTAKVGVLRRD